MVDRVAAMRLRIGHHVFAGNSDVGLTFQPALGVLARTSRCRLITYGRLVRKKVDSNVKSVWAANTLV
jgi:hypothetical protein